MSTQQEPSAWKKTILAAMTSYIDAGAAGLSMWQQYLNMDGVQMGALAALSSNAASAAVGALVGGRICDRYGRKFVYTYDLLVYIAGMLLIVFGVNYAMLLGGYIIVGLGVGADIVASWTLIAEEAPAEDRAKHCGSAQFAWALGPAVVLLVSAWINQYGLIGNRIVFGHLILVALWVWWQRLKMPKSNPSKRQKQRNNNLLLKVKSRKSLTANCLAALTSRLSFSFAAFTQFGICAQALGVLLCRTSMKTSDTCPTVCLNLCRSALSF